MTQRKTKGVSVTATYYTERKKNDLAKGEPGTWDQKFKWSRDQDGMNRPYQQLKLNFHVILKNNTSFDTDVSVKFIRVLFVTDFCFLKCYCMVCI